MKKLSDFSLRFQTKSSPGSNVFIASTRKDGPGLVALKQYQLDNETEIDLQENEIRTMRELCHPNLLPLLNAFVLGQDCFLVTPFMPFGSAKDIMENYFITGFPEMICSLIARDVLSGLAYMHKRGYIHRSIRASHILLDDRAKLTGFQLCKCIVEHGVRAKTCHDYPDYPEKELTWLAPEILEQNLLGFNEKSDLYSFGITLCELGNNLTPFSNVATTFMFTQKLRGNQPSLLDCSTCVTDDIVEKAIDQDRDEDFMAQIKRLYSERKLTDSFHKFVETCMEKDPKQRASIKKLQAHQFIKQSRNNSLNEQFAIFGVNKIAFNAANEEAALSDERDENNDVTKEDGDNFDWEF